MKNVSVSLLCILMLLSCNSRQSRIQWSNDISLPDYSWQGKNKGLAGAYSGFLNDSLLMVYGGANFPEKYPWENGDKKYWSDVYIYNIKTKEWTLSADKSLPPSAYGVTVQLKSGLLIIGGCDNMKCYNNVTFISKDEKDLKIDTLTYPQLPFPLANMGMAFLDNCVYLLGGQKDLQKGKSEKVFLRLDLNKKPYKWEHLPLIPGCGRGYSVCQAQKGKIYMFSGRSYSNDSATNYLSDAFVYDPKTNSWDKLPGVYNVMAATSFSYDKNKIVLLGGVEKILPTTSNHPGFTRRILFFDVEKNEIIDSLFCPYEIPVTTNLVAKGNSFYLVSGEIRPGVRTPIVLKGILDKNIE